MVQSTSNWHDPLELGTRNSELGTVLQIAQFAHCTEAEGPGKRFAIWFQGCPLRCPGCCNPEFLPFKGGESWKLEDLLAEIDHAKAEQGIEGITLLGGEPLAHASGAAALARAAWQRGLTVMVFSGYTIQQAKSMSDRAVADLLAHIDILVDGPYVRELPDTQRRWIGSTNQRIHFLTDRYCPDDSCWRQKNTLEIRLDAMGLSVNGFPAASAVGLWKRPRKLPTKVEK
jgi:anaerobic ribonucleoside-triphosphate reductase activating protein